MISVSVVKDKKTGSADTLCFQCFDANVGGKKTRRSLLLYYMIPNIKKLYFELKTSV